MTREDDGHIDFVGLPNTRDLGGLETADGRHVRFGMLLRSGALDFGTDEDLARLRDEYRLRSIVDFRDNDELAELPDPTDAFPEASYLHVSVIDGVAPGISQSMEARQGRDALGLTDEDGAFLMEMLYANLLLDEVGRSGYHAFLETLLSTDDGAALWHCTMGRDRAGLGAAIVEGILGVPYDLIEWDYLATNRFYPDSPQDPTRASLRSFRAARTSVIEAFGSFEAFVSDGLDFSAADQRAIRDRYLA